MVITDSPNLSKYRETMADIMQLYMSADREELYQVIDYSINKRYHESRCKVENTYTNKSYNMTLLKMADYIIDLGPDGGDKGGRIVATGTPEDIAKVKSSYTGYYIKRSLDEDKARKEKIKWVQYFFT